MIAGTVSLWIAIALPDHRPLEYSEPMESLELCMSEAKRFLDRPLDSILLKGATLGAGCTVEIAPSVEH